MSLRRAAWALVLLVAGCKVGPNFTPPHEPVPEQYAGASVTQPPGPDRPRVTAAAPDDFWWREFRDPALERLVAEVTAGNLDLKVAYVRIVEARLQAHAARAQGLPSLNASASFTREQLGIAGLAKSQHLSGPAVSAVGPLLASIEPPIDLYQVGFDASWELDLFGKVRRSVEAADAQSAVALEARNDLLISLQAEAVQNYLGLRAAQELERIVDEEIAAEREVLDLTRSRHEHGLASEGEVDSATAQLANLESQRPPYQQTIATSRHALAVLCGVDPERFDARFGESGALPEMPAEVPVGVPSTLARRRPDVRNAEASLHAATAEVGVSVAQLFPDITLKGSYGVRNLGTAYLFDWQSRFYTLGPTITIPIFHGGQLLTNVRLSKAQAVEAAINYRKTVLGALQEVEDALTSLEEDAARTAALRATVAADRKAVEVDLDAFHHGLLTYINVLSVQIQEIEARQQLEQALLTQRTDLVKLFKALGGGWQSAPVPPGTSSPADTPATSGAR